MPLISEAEYLRGGYDPECELHDGVLVPRTGGMTRHSFLQAEQILQTPPLLVIEILSPEDRVIEENLKSELHDERGRTQVADGVLRIPGTPIEVPLRLLEEDR